MKDNDLLVQFSIYKINIEKVENVISLEKNDDANKIISEIAEYLSNCIKKNEDNVLISDFDLLIINYTCNEETGKAE